MQKCTFKPRTNPRSNSKTNVSLNRSNIFEELYGDIDKFKVRTNKDPNEIEFEKSKN